MTTKYLQNDMIMIGYDNDECIYKYVVKWYEVDMI